jgi:hypothetical protein
MRNLVISAIGDQSVYSTWLDAAERRTFDLVFVYFGDGPDDARSHATHYFRRKGYKFEHLAFVRQELAAELSQYDYIWCPDDDVAAGTDAINELFAICAEHQLELAQPAIAAGDYSYASLKQQKQFLLRYTPFVEVMCPLFSQAAFQKVSVLFGENYSGWGLDWLWSRMFPRERMAIVDKVGIHHTRPLFSGPHYRHLVRDGIDPRDEFQRTMDRHGGMDHGVQAAMVEGTCRMKGLLNSEELGPFRRLLHRFWPGALPGTHRAAA